MHREDEEQVGGSKASGRKTAEQETGIGKSCTSTAPVGGKRENGGSVKTPKARAGNRGAGRSGHAQLDDLIVGVGQGGGGHGGGGGRHRQLDDVIVRAGGGGGSAGGGAGQHGGLGS